MKEILNKLVTVINANSEAGQEIIDGFDKAFMTEPSAIDAILNGAYKAQCYDDGQDLKDVVEYLEWAHQQASEFRAMRASSKKKKSA